MNYFIHNTAEVSDKAKIGNGSKIWNLAQVREDVVIGNNCIIGKNVYIDFGVSVGNNCKIQNNSSLYHGTTIEDGVFVGPHVLLINDKLPRAINADGSIKGNDDWLVGEIVIKYGASIGAGAIILPGVTVGKFALVGSGAVVTKNVPDFGLVYGNPAKLVGLVDESGKLIEKI